VGRSVLVTGGSRGIGRAAALRLARDGFDVAVGYRSRTADAEAVVRACGGNAVAIGGDVRDDAVGIVQRAAAELGGLDALVHCAVEPVRARVLELDADEWTRALETNARSFLLAAQAAVVAGATRVVALSATGGHRIRNPEYAPMGIAKAAVETTVRFLAVELMPRGVTVNAVSPGLLDTDSSRLYVERGLGLS
jgi:NAD(P)-dependent dehydrogenase (short-subunit alcohol dehydrogenase family)